MMKINNTSISLLIIAILSITGIWTLKGDESISSVLYTICLTLFVSSIFFTITVFMPENKKRKRIRRGLRKQYRSFKLRCIGLFLIASDSQDYPYPENLLNHLEFRRYFSIRVTNSQSRWDRVATSIDNQDYIFDEIVRELDFFIREVEFARSSVDIDDEKVDEFFVKMIQAIHTIKSAKADTDDYKHFFRTLWSIFTRWNFIDGQLEEDIIESMIEKI